MKGEDVRSRDFVDLVSAKFRPYVELNEPFVVVNRLLFVAPRNVLLQKPVADLSHGRRQPQVLTVLARIITGRHFGKPLAGDVSGLLGCDRAVLANKGPALGASLSPVVDKIGSLALGGDLAPKPLQLSIPEDNVARAYRNGLHSSFGDFGLRHALDPPIQLLGRSLGL